MSSTPGNNSEWVDTAMAIEGGQGIKKTGPSELKKWVTPQSDQPGPSTV